MTDNVNKPSVDNSAELNKQQNQTENVQTPEIKEESLADRILREKAEKDAKAAKSSTDDVVAEVSETPKKTETILNKSYRTKRFFSDRIFSICFKVL